MPQSPDVHYSEKKIYFENGQKTGHALICLLCLDPNPLWEFVSVMLTILQSQECAELGFNVIEN